MTTRQDAEMRLAAMLEKIRNAGHMSEAEYVRQLEQVDLAYSTQPMSMGN